MVDTNRFENTKRNKSFYILNNGGNQAKIEFSNDLSPDRLISFNKKSTQKDHEFYEELYSNGNKTVDPLKQTRVAQFSTILQHLKKISITNNPETTYIDIGAGPGHFVDFLRNQLSDKVIGIEPAAKKENEYLKKLALKEVNEQYDFVFMLDVFEHFESPSQAIQKVHSITSKNGYICFKVPNKDSLLYRTAKLLKMIKPFSNKIFWRLYQVDFPPPHYFYYNKKSLTKIVSTHFEVVDSFYVSELPISAISSRLWGLNPILKAIILPIALIYSLISIGSLKDGLVVIAKKNQLIFNHLQITT